MYWPVTRWRADGAYRTVWLLGGDGDYDEQMEKWKQIGRAVFGAPHGNLVTMHPRGTYWPNEELRTEPWLSFASYQSGHGDNEERLRWFVQGPPATQWRALPKLPIINQEPNYEKMISRHQRRVYGAFEVRRALYWSLLISPCAGVTYGHQSIWPWLEVRGVPKDHENTGEAPPWNESLETEGTTSVMHLKRFFDGVAWWLLRPMPTWLAHQPGHDDPFHFIAIARAEDGSFGVAYTPSGQPIALKVDEEATFTRHHWFDPRTGELQVASGANASHFTPPAEQDWVLLLRR